MLIAHKWSRKGFKNQLFWFFFGVFSYQGGILASESLKHRQIPDEYEAVGGHALGLDNSGAAGLGGIAAARINPALIPYDSEYSLYLGYHWPSAGRDFYQVGVVDTVTSKIGAAFNYTSFTEDYKKFKSTNPNELDSPLRNRAVLAFAGTLSKLSLGISGQYLDGYTQAMDGSDERLKGLTLGAGISGLITPFIKFGVSGENLSNRKVRNFAPQTIRVGTALLMFEGNFSWQLDLQQRERIDVFENDNLPTTSDGGPEHKFTDPERMIINSISVRVMNIVRLLGAYGYSISSDKRRSLSGALGLVQNKFAITYGISRGYWEQDASHQALDLHIVFTF